MKIGQSPHSYEWIDSWARIPVTPLGKADGRTHGVAVSSDGRIFVFHQADPAVLIFDPAGRLLGSWGNRFRGAHGMTLVNEGGTDYLWLADYGTKEVVKTTLTGESVLNLPLPPHPVYSDAKPYMPTWVAVNAPRFGGNGDVWVADGYGQSLVHRYTQKGEYLQTLDGTEGGGRFNCPHGVAFDYRRGEPELYVADRGNRRFQVYDAEGRFKRVFGQDFLIGPDCCLTVGKTLVVPELFARLTILDEHDKPAAYLGENTPVCKAEGWPQVRPELIQPGKFNSPHSAAADAAGNLYVVEWIVGGRITKLRKAG